MPSEPPDIRNWFPSYVYESPPLDSALDFGISFCGVAEHGKLYVEEKSCSRNTRDTMASFSVEKIKLGTLKNTSDVVVEFPNMVEGTKLDNQSDCKVFFSLHLSLICLVYVYSTRIIVLCILCKAFLNYSMSRHRGQNSFQRTSFKDRVPKWL